MNNEKEVAAIFGNIENITDANAIDRIYGMLKDRTTSINRREAGAFRLNQHVKFRSEKGLYEGTIESIGRTGRVKIALVNNSRYSHYTLGAGHLKSNIIE